MKTAYYFAELAAAYDAELQDLEGDSEGRSVLAARLREKRQSLPDLLPMIAFSPEMVAPVFYRSFTFTQSAPWLAAIACEPDDGDFPAWASLAPFVTVDSAVAPFLPLILAEPEGDAFLVTAACLEFMRTASGLATPTSSSGKDSDADEEEDDPDREDNEEGLAEAGDNWLVEQGFDSFKQ